jgi:hypothetical protein
MPTRDEQLADVDQRIRQARQDLAYAKAREQHSTNADTIAAGILAEAELNDLLEERFTIQQHPAEAGR